MKTNKKWDAIIMPEISIKEEKNEVRNLLYRIERAYIEQYTNSSWDKEVRKEINALIMPINALRRPVSEAAMNDWKFQMESLIAELKRSR